ncbi:MAG: hypothetical protein JSU70_05890, partial [Phycisphaerales bacterium]
NKIYAIGGRAGWAGLTTNEEYDPVTNTWATKAPMPTGRLGLTATAAYNKIYAIGGYGGSPLVRLATNEEYDPAADTWTAKTPMPEPREGHTATVVSHRIYVIGGFRGWGDTDEGIVGTNEEYSPATDTWATKTPKPGTVVTNHGAAAVDGLVYVFSQSETTAYDPIVDTWTRYLAAIPTYRGHYATAVMDHKIYTIGGEDSTQPGIQPLATNEEYDPVTDTWTPMSLMPTDRWGMQAATVGNKTYVIGGLDITTTYTSANEEFTFEADVYRYYIHRKD